MLIQNIIEVPLNKNKKVVGENNDAESALLSSLAAAEEN